MEAEVKKKVTPTVDIFSLRKIAVNLGIPYMKIYNNNAGVYNSFTHEEIDEIITFIHDSADVLRSNLSR